MTKTVLAKLSPLKVYKVLFNSRWVRTVGDCVYYACKFIFILFFSFISCYLYKISHSLLCFQKTYAEAGSTTYMLASAHFIGYRTNLYKNMSNWVPIDRAPLSTHVVDFTTDLDRCKGNMF